MDVARHPRMFATDRHGPNEGRTRLDRWTIDPGVSKVSESCLDDHPQEFPRLDERRAGKAYRYGYTAEVGAGFVTGGIRKHDLVEGRVTAYQPPAHRHCFEPVFVAASDSAAEDEGWLMAYVHDDERNASDVIVLNAQDLEAGPLATITLPRRVPYGFHGNWVADPV